MVLCTKCLDLVVGGPGHGVPTTAYSMEITALVLCFPSFPLEAKGSQAGRQAGCM